MEKLMKPAEYAKELGISRQAVYAKIKRGILTAKNVDGKLYIVVDNSIKAAENVVKTETEKPKTARPAASASQSRAKDYESLLAAKDETISVLKGTVKDLKKSNKQISTTLKGEIDLLKEAFHEMRNLYVLQIEHQKQEAIEVISEEESVEVVEEKWVSVKKFFKKVGVTKEKQQEKMMKRLKKAHKGGEEYLMKEEGKWKINLNKNYKDLLK